MNCVFFFVGGDTVHIQMKMLIRKLSMNPAFRKVAGKGDENVAYAVV